MKTQERFANQAEGNDSVIILDAIADVYTLIIEGTNPQDTSHGMATLAVDCKVEETQVKIIRISELRSFRQPVKVPLLWALYCLPTIIKNWPDRKVILPALNEHNPA